jgi:hypothetical protein
MRRLLPVGLLGISIAIAACSSGATATTAPGGAATPAATEAPATPAAATPEVATPAPATPEAATPVPSVDDSAIGQQFAQIQTDLQAELSKVTASMMTATTPAALAAALKDYAAVSHKAIAAARAQQWPPAISGDIDKLFTYQEELLGVMEKGITDPSAIDQAKLAQIQAEMPAVAQRIAAYFGVQTP